MSIRLRISLIMLIGVMLASEPVFAASAVVGSVAGSMNASVGGQALLPNTTVFSGDSLQVKEGAAVVALDNGNRVALGKDTVASFLRNNDAVTVVLKEGNVSLFHPDSKTALKVQAGGVTVESAPGFKTLGEVAMVNGTVMITAKDGTLQVNENGKTVEVAKGKTIALVPKTARAPQTGGSQKLGGAPAWVDYTILVAAGLAFGFAIAGYVKASDASNTAASALSAANVAAANAASAISAAQASGSEAVSAADSARAALTSFLQSAFVIQHAELVNVGCSLNTLAADNFITVSPYTPLVGSCPAGLSITPF
jgi:hypothetical protein